MFHTGHIDRMACDVISGTEVYKTPVRLLDQNSRSSSTPPALLLTAPD